MATGFEALGAASAILQVISFAGNLATLCYKIYDGQPTLGSDIEEYASQTLDWAERVRARSQAMPRVTANEKKLAEVAQKCVDAAKALEMETQLLTKRYQKGKFLRAVYDSIHSSQHMTKIKQLQGSLEDCIQVMEKHLLLSICDKNTAIEQQQGGGFEDLESDVKYLLLRIGEGYTSIEDLIMSEQHITRGIVTREAETTREQVSTHVTSELRALGTRATSDRQRERLLKSLKADEMNQRYNRIMDPEDASFERVFASYQRVSRKDPEYKTWKKMVKTVQINMDWRIHGENLNDIDQAWSCFCWWLRSSDEMFWIRGKPGSGKSTLIKFMVENDNTKRLLDYWSPGTRIISHFFWKIGTSPQNSVHGLLCSLLHRTLCEDSNTVDQVLGRFAFSLSKDSCHDWSTGELERVLFFVLGTSACSTCIFIDGLDEISDKDGVSNLMSLVERLQSCDKVKTCVSSRPETKLVNKLKAIRAKTLRLEDLTKPEMAVYVHRKLARYAENGQISATLLKDLTRNLLDQARGVFLWLFLATNSLITGIENRDDEKTLLGRLRELPGELEVLYHQMWERFNTSNPAYREIAGRYFRYAITGNTRMGIWKEGTYGPILYFDTLTLGRVALAEHILIQEHFFPRADISLADLKLLCETTAENIRTRCAGMLQLFPGPTTAIYSSDPFPEGLQQLLQGVDFIHRTAHDFFVDTEAGQRILNYKHNASVALDMDITLAKSTICLAVTLDRKFEMITRIQNVIDVCARLIHRAVGQDAARELLPIIKRLYEGGTFAFHRHQWYPRPEFLSLLASRSPVLDDFVMSSLERADSLGLATDVLSDIIGMHCYDHEPPTALIHQLLALGANPHVAGTPTFIATGHSEFSQQVTAFGLSIRGAIDQLLSGASPSHMPALVSVIDAMARTCPDWRQKETIMIIERYKTLTSPITLAVSMWGGSSSTGTRDWGVCEVDLQFLLTRFLAAADSRKVPTHDSGLGTLAASFTEPHVRIRHINSRPLSRFGQVEYCYRPLSQQPFQGLIDYIFGPRDGNTMSIEDVCALVEALGNPSSLTYSSSSWVRCLQGNYETVDYRSEMDALAAEG